MQVSFSYKLGSLLCSVLSCNGMQQHADLYKQAHACRLKPCLHRDIIVPAALRHFMMTVALNIS